MWTMELVLVWAVCVLIVGVGFCGKQLTKLTLKEKEANLTGNVFLGIMCLLAGLIIYISTIVMAINNRP